MHLATYAVGDIQGCYADLRAALKSINFSPTKDTLWCVGDLINRGPQSLEVMQFILDLGEHARIVLGNHELHALCLYYGAQSYRKGDTLDALLNHTEAEQIIQWLLKQPLLYQDEAFNTCMVHAGILPGWSITQAKEYAREVESALQGPHCQAWLNAMYGNQPALWANSLEGFDRLRTITNIFTRMRYCYVNGKLELDFKGPLTDAPADLIPWFSLPNAQYNMTVLFGHWASLGAQTSRTDIIGLDSGCVWGGKLTLVELQADGQVQQRF